MSTRVRLLGVMLVAAVSGCAETTGGFKEMKLRVDRDPKASIPTGGAYSWMIRPGKVPKDQRVDVLPLRARIREAVERELGRKGYEHVGLGYEVGFLLAYEVAVEDVLDPGSIDREHGYAPGGLSPTSTQRYAKGSVIIDVIHPKTKRLMWRGIAEAEVTVVATEDEKRKRINEAVRRILERFPPK